ncbi:phosphoglycerate mutase [Acetobacter estunensis NRIC 0472]|uniref:Histidine phosphatase family protein n=1 Tax=Acetobacter estunensis TaxID=104097 RepID=A0A967B8T3_9PROT|nr:histidine phosphatase family protein [Acetobacter estunensis]NHO54266.1 histidine phosphatase family protein [Acetobacter estunensis]GBQ28710.1 phosphoglycerate mutase [Acetobacter estunensis NRIC 0472]
MIVLRHCQSEFNRLFTATRRDPGISDPPLSAHGHEQAQELVARLRGEDIRRIIVSPYRRALQTAAPLARVLGITPIVEPLVRERVAFSCDEGSPASQLALEWPDLDFSGLSEGWWSESPEPQHMVEDRAALFRTAIGALPQARHTLVVSHWCFLLAFVGESMENGTWRRLDDRVLHGTD